MKELPMPRRRPGRQRFFDGTEDFKKCYLTYIEAIFESDFQEPPSFAGFARFWNISPKTVYRYMKDYPELREFVMEPTADALVVGAINGKYKSTPAIFALKNRCGWADKVESRDVTADKRVATKEEADKKLEEYMKNIKKRA